MPNTLTATEALALLLAALSARYDEVGGSDMKADDDGVSATIHIGTQSFFVSINKGA